MAVNLFDVRTMLAAVTTDFQPKTFLVKTFFGEQEVFETQSVDIDVVKGGRLMAPFVRQRKGAQTYDRVGFETRSFTPPLVGGQLPTTAEDLMKRTPGETIYGQEKTPVQRAAERLGKDLRVLDESITRREEFMAAQCLFGGKIAVKNLDENIDAVIDFKLPEETLSGSSLWSADTSDPIADLEKWASEMRKSSGYSPTMCILGRKAMAALLNHKKLKDALDLRRVEYGQIKPEELENGVFYAGYLATVGLTVDLYAYEEWANDDTSKSLVPIVPEGKLLLANPAASSKCFTVP